MNLFFNTRKPRRFHHEMIYADERREKLEQIERRARKELGMDDEWSRKEKAVGDSLPDVSGIHFVADYRRRRRKGLFGSLASSGFILLLIVFIVVLLLII